MSSWMFLLYMPWALSLLGGTIDFGKSKSRNELNSSGEKLEGLGRPRNILKGKTNYSLKIPSCFHPTPDYALLGNMRENRWEVVRNHWLNTLHPRRGEMESGDAGRAPGEMKDWYVRTQIYCGAAKSIHQEWGPRLELGKIEVYLERPGIDSAEDSDLKEWEDSLLSSLKAEPEALKKGNTITPTFMEGCDMLDPKCCSFSSHNCPVHTAQDYPHFSGEKTKNKELGSLTRITCNVWLQFYLVLNSGLNYSQLPALISAAEEWSDWVSDSFKNEVTVIRIVLINVNDETC